ncbi:hypothetical protein H4219_000866 [Mycoemilia scoparia]|uniref:Uncharacterized protein n=1 Tax=Mycoemilia scoparia TaxID=417184 RepID=A0A9W8A2T7_9FUNG|nr:hypothetical protein H4219_000866 [Mycoemilia scoparia]
MSTPTPLTNENLQALQDNDLFEYNSDLETLTTISSDSTSEREEEEADDDPLPEEQNTENNVLNSTEASEAPEINDRTRPSSSQSSPKAKDESLTDTKDCLSSADGKSKDNAPSPMAKECMDIADNAQPSPCKELDQPAMEIETESEDEEALEARRIEALKELTQIEVDFAHLRERLFCERITQLDRERYLLFNSQHPEYQNQINDITNSHNERVEKLKLWHQLRVQQRKKLHASKIEGIKYNYNIHRQAIRGRFIDDQLALLFKLKEAHRRLEREHDDPQKLAVQHTSSYYFRYITRNQKRPRKQQLKFILPKLLPAEQNEDFTAMGLPVQNQEKHTQRKIFVPSYAPDPNERKRQKPKQAVRVPAGLPHISVKPATSMSNGRTKPGGGGAGPARLNANANGVQSQTYTVQAFPTQSYPLDSLS